MFNSRKLDKAIEKMQTVWADDETYDIVGELADDETLVELSLAQSVQPFGQYRCLEALANRNSQVGFDAILTRFKRSGVSRRTDLLGLLHTCDSGRAFPILLEMMNDKDSSLSEKAIQLICKTQSSEAFEVLLDIVYRTIDPKYEPKYKNLKGWTITDEILQALSLYSDHRKTEALLLLLQKHDASRFFAFKTLAKDKRPQVTEAMSETFLHLSSEYHGIRSKLWEELKHRNWRPKTVRGLVAYALYADRPDLFAKPKKGMAFLLAEETNFNPNKHFVQTIAFAWAFVQGDQARFEIESKLDSKMDIIKYEPMIRAGIRLGSTRVVDWLVTGSAFRSKMSYASETNNPHFKSNYYAMTNARRLAELLIFGLESLGEQVSPETLTKVSQMAPLEYHEQTVIERGNGDAIYPDKIIVHSSAERLGEAQSLAKSLLARKE